MYRDELDMFAGSIAANQLSELSAQNGCQAVAAVYAALKSAQNSGRKVELDEVIEAARGANSRRRGAAGGR